MMLFGVDIVKNLFVKNVDILVPVEIMCFVVLVKKKKEAIVFNVDRLFVIIVPLNVLNVVKIIVLLVEVVLQNYFLKNGTMSIVLNVILNL